MPNFTVEEISQAIVEILEEAKGQGIVIDDKKFSQSDKELARLLKSQADDDEWRGWIVSWLSIPLQVDDGDCIVNTTYRFFAKFFHFYADDYKENLSTDTSFKRAILEANEALNDSRDLGLGNLVRHTGLQSQADFDIEDIGGGAGNQICHTAPFTLDVVVTNSY
jgi:hypothetical protein